jgi:hypothetical protein
MRSANTNLLSRLAGTAVETVVGGAVGGTGGLLLGTFAGCLDGFLHLDFTRLPVDAAGAALAGAVAGALVLGAGRFLDGVGLFSEGPETEGDQTLAAANARLPSGWKRSAAGRKGVYHRLGTYFSSVAHGR